jgi:hypothetical protein
MITVKVTYTGSGVNLRTAQIVSAGPPGTVNTHWARTCDDLPPEWLLVSERSDKMTGKTEYTAVHGNAGLA